MAVLHATTETDHEIEQTATTVWDEDVSALIQRDDGPTGEPGALDWLNWACVKADHEDDAVRCLVSLGDPRGAIQFTVRRMPDGRIIISTPHAEQGERHVEVREIFPGTLEVI